MKSEVALTLKNSDRIVAIITNDSVQSLGLSEGVDAYAIVKAGSVIIGEGEDKPRVSIRNKLPGRIVSLSRGTVNKEIDVELAGDNRICAVITNECARDLDLAEGSQVWAMFKASSVILGVG